MKKIFIVILLLVAGTSITHASVDSDTRAIQYQACIAKLVDMEAKRPKDPATTPIFNSRPGDTQPVSKDAAYAYYNSYQAKLDAQKALCQSLSGSQTSSNAKNATLVASKEQSYGMVQFTHDPADQARILELEDQVDLQEKKMMLLSMLLIINSTLLILVGAIGVVMARRRV